MDNGSEKPEGKILKKEFPLLRLIESKENLGFTGGNNLAWREIKEGKADFALTLNNDTMVDQIFISELVKVAEEDAQIGAVAAKMLFYDQPQVIENVGHDLLVSGDIVPRGRGERESLYTSVVEVMGACGGAALWRVKMLKQIGFFRQDFFANYEDADLSLRGIVAGWRFVFAPKAVVYHKHNVSIKKIRDFNFNLRSQKNQLLAYFYNLPLLVILFNLPFVIVRDLGVTLVVLIFGRFDLLKVFWLARFFLWKNWRHIFQERRKIQKMRRVKSFAILRKQKFFFPLYFNYFWRIVILREFSALTASSRAKKD